MAPITLSKVDEELKEAVQHLYEIQSAVHGYLGPETQQELVRKLQSLTVSLQKLSQHTAPPDPSSSSPSAPSSTSQLPPLSSKDPELHSIQLPPEIIEYVDAARNPDIYTREFVELVQRGNQDLKGKAEAFAGFRDVLAREMASAMPECRSQVDRVVRATGGEGRGDLTYSRT